MIIEKLRAQTQRLHQELDHTVYPHIQQIRTAEQYSRLLQVFYGFFKPMQQQFDQFLSDKLINDYTDRRKAEWILQDLNALNNSDKQDLSLCTELPDIDNEPRAFGSFYVLEGSSMGGAIISKKIGENLGITEDKGLKFFKAYGENNRLMWNNFLTDMEHNIQNQVNADQLIESASQTFGTFKNWIVKNYGG